MLACSPTFLAMANTLRFIGAVPGFIGDLRSMLEFPNCKKSEFSMAILIHDCPHCPARNTGFTIYSEIQLPDKPGVYAVNALCNACRMPICAVVRAAQPNVQAPKALGGNLFADDSYFTKVAMYPDSAVDETPASTPQPVAKAFRQAAGSRKAGHLDAACSMYRKAMELGLKAFSPDIDAWKIEKRIDKMAAEHRITPELQTWAHELRLDGNEALHGDGEATQDMADQMHELCRFLLTYLYTLPAQVADAQARRDG